MTRRRRTAAELLGDDPPRRSRPPKPPVKDHRQKLVLAQARLADIRADKLSGKLLERADVADLWAGIIADIRSALLAAPARIGGRLSWTPDAVAALDAEIREILAALAASKALPDA
jgi:phage terminase Nu1 subunit (DNA packaging protein)